MPNTEIITSLIDCKEIKIEDNSDTGSFGIGDIEEVSLTAKDFETGEILFELSTPDLTYPFIGDEFTLNAESLGVDKLKDTIYFIELTIKYDDGSEQETAIGTSALFKFCDFLCCFQDQMAKLPEVKDDFNVYSYNTSRAIFTDLFFTSSTSAFNLRRYTESIKHFRTAEKLCKHVKRNK